MTRYIWKYPLPFMPERELTLPLGSTPLTVQPQNGVPCLWVETDSFALTEEQWTVRMLVTGQRFDEAGDYLGTVQLQGDTFVVHVYVKRPDA